MVGVGAGDPSLHDLQVAANFPFFYLGDASVVSDSLWGEEGEDLGEERIEFGYVEGVGEDEVAHFGEFLAEGVTGYEGFGAFHYQGECGIVGFFLVVICAGSCGVESVGGVELTDREWIQSLLGHFLF